MIDNVLKRCHDRLGGGERVLKTILKIVAIGNAVLDIDRQVACAKSIGNDTFELRQAVAEILCAVQSQALQRRIVREPHIQT